MEGLADLTPAQIEALLRIVGIVDLVAVAVFAITGALVAARREMDPIGFVFLGTVTGIGGGTFRDLVLGIEPVFWVVQPAYLWTCIGASLATFWAARLLASRFRALLWLDAAGLGLFAITGTQKAVAMGAPAVVCVLMGVMTVAVGGLIRDIMAGEKPLLFHREIYATAAIAGAVSYLLLRAADLPEPLTALGGFAVGFGVRACAIAFGLSMPAYKRPDRPLDGPAG
ncbi:trimeric intracellular cation channel family protein [Novispirillum sp. DQ9]|uniref:trimeric intracellular cation channel family protein n=1 Tax=Novispirillum sp. DQ9 TaxID=3398612 RepID=UPI003C7B5EE7